MLQKKKSPEEEDKKKPDESAPNEALKKAADAKDLLGRLDEASKKKEENGFWSSCCGVRVWIPE